MKSDWGEFIPFFRELSQGQIKQIEDISTVYDCSAGDTIYLQGEFCQNWTIINKGNFLCKKEDQNGDVLENILLEGDMFDFTSILSSSITTMGLEAIQDSSLLVIDILGLKRLSKKSPSLISLISLSFSEEDSKIWNNLFFKEEVKKIGSKFKIRKSFRVVVMEMIPLFVLLVLLPNTVLLFFKTAFGKYVFIGTFFLWIILLILYYFNSRLSFVEINREYIVKRIFNITNGHSQKSSIPLGKITGTRIEYKSRLFRVMHIGSITFESPTENLIINGIYKPKERLEGINTFKNSTVAINKAIELSSFRSLYCKDKGLFYIESQLESWGHKEFTFHKTILYFLAKTLPPFIFIFATSIGMAMVLHNWKYFLFNIFSLSYFLWHLGDWLNDRYAFEGAKVVDIEKKPLWGKERRIEADLVSVKSIRKEQKNFIELLFNYGTIEIETLGGKIIYPFIHNPDRVIENLYLVKQYYYSMQESRNKIERQEEFLNYTKYYQELSKT